MRERWTSGVHLPSYVHRSIHARHHDSACERSRSGSPAAEGPAVEGCQLRVKGTRVPAGTANRATVVGSSPLASTGVRSVRASGPATASSAEPTRRTQGTIHPWSKRMTSCIRMGTRPRTPSTIRTRSAWR